MPLSRMTRRQTTFASGSQCYQERSPEPVAEPVRAKRGRKAAVPAADAQGDAG